MALKESFDLDPDAPKILDSFFAITGDRAVTPLQHGVNKEIQLTLRNAADSILATIQPCRERSIALTKLEEALMWAGKAIYKEEE